ncbi:MAG: hypothetical protein QG625_88 [Cyanobacteriota bacterium erpe_2018_sw_39hr_WHONDRS-SW48-000098_B_bin.30]|jgi:MFS superfamily sulfate permease-like transporter|nr:hypothetical protein [Cyanobacteriota bacterium erpe_2018_sw_39hr_WHONDRS-SW48-000098_B_bin.30]
MALRSQKELWNSFKSMATGQFQAISGLQTAVAAEVPDAPQRSVPTDRLAGLRENWRHDIVSGFILFLIALPLSLGIAMASGMPPMSGIIAACIGGIVVSQISGSYVTINGPAAGLIVVILDGVQALGGGAQGYHNTLTAIVVAGLLLFVLGLFKAGELGKFFPSSVVHGMLASIGLIIILKQLPIMLGVVPPAKEPLALLAKLPFIIMSANPYVALIGVIGLLILIVHTRIKMPMIRRIPAPILVVLSACWLSSIFKFTEAHDYTFMGQVFSILPKKLLVQIPTDCSSYLSFPDLTAFSMPRFFPVVLTITLVQGIETVLSCSAVDKLDPFKRKADLSRDLSAVGLGSAISGAIGGLPLIAEIVRSTANIANGARTRYSNFFHGLFILVFVLTSASMLNRIPLAALAALLVFTGYRLAAPRVFKETHEIGWEQTVLFVGTIVVTLATDLLIGVFTGVALKLFLHIIRGVKPIELFKSRVQIEKTGDKQVAVRIVGPAIFSNYMSIKKQLDSIEPGQKVTFELDRMSFVDHTVMEHFHDFQKDYKCTRGTVTFAGLELHKSTSQHSQSSRKLEKVS